jgi:hypothetical protein
VQVGTATLSDRGPTLAVFRMADGG